MDSQWSHDLVNPAAFQDKIAVWPVIVFQCRRSPHHIQSSDILTYRLLWSTDCSHWLTNRVMLLNPKCSEWPTPASLIIKELMDSRFNCLWLYEQPAGCTNEPNHSKRSLQTDSKNTTTSWIVKNNNDNISQLKLTSGKMFEHTQRRESNWF